MGFFWLIVKKVMLWVALYIMIDYILCICKQKCCGVSGFILLHFEHFLNSTDFLTICMLKSQSRLKFLAILHHVSSALGFLVNCIWYVIAADFDK